MGAEQRIKQYLVSETINLGTLGVLAAGTILQERNSSSVFQVVSIPESAPVNQIDTSMPFFTLDRYIVTAMLYQLDVVAA